MEPGDAVCDIQTDKAVMSLEVDEEGVLAKIIRPADSGSIKVKHFPNNLFPYCEEKDQYLSFETVYTLDQYNLETPYEVNPFQIYT